MRKSILLAAALLFGTAGFAQWQPVGDKIKTPWADQVDPQNPLPEYPRPLMERDRWQNLNGLWDYAIVPVGAQPEKYDGKILVPFARRIESFGRSEASRRRERTMVFARVRRAC